MIFGRPGSGKSTFAYELHKKTGLPLYHLDKYFYIENWVERDYQEFLDIQQELVNQSRWIIDGNCTRSLEMRYQKADLCLYFNYPKYTCIFRILKRHIKGSPFDDRAPGCKEKTDLKFLKYIWTFENRVDDKIATLKSKYPGVRFIEINNNTDLKQLKKELFRA